MAIQHDSRGFLIGDPIDLGKMPNYLADIGRDLESIKSATIGNGKFLNKISTTAVTPKANAAYSGVLPAINQKISEPIQKGFSQLSSSQEKQVGLLRKTLSSLNFLRKDESLFNRESKKILKSINEKPGQINSINTIGTNSNLFSTAKNLFKPGLLSTAMGYGKKLLRKIPVVGSLIAGAGAANDIFSSENNPNLTRAQKDAAAGKSVGGWSGTLAGIGAGAAAGSAVMPGVGTVVGGVVGGFLGDQAGQIIGEKFGKWVSELRQSDVPGQLSSLFQQWLKRTQSNLNTFGDFVSEQFNDLNNYTKNSAGIDLKQIGSAWWERTKTNTQSGIDWLGDNTTIGHSIKSIPGIPGLSNAEAAAYANEVKRTESSGNYQAQNKQGFIGAYQMGASALSDAGLIDPLKLKAAQKIGGFNQSSFLSDDSNWTIPGGKSTFLSDSALQDKAFSDMQNINLTRGVKSGAISMGASPERIAAYLKAAHIGGATGASNYFLKGSDRADSNGTSISRYAMQGANAIRSISRSAPAISVAPAPTMPKIAEAPAVAMPLNSPSKEVQTVRIENNNDVDRRISDWRLAHIQTGGIAPWW